MLEAAGVDYVARVGRSARYWLKKVFGMSVLNPARCWVA